MRSVADDFHSLIGLAAAGARGKRYRGNISDWYEIVRMASEHGVIPLIGSAIMQSPELFPVEIKEFCVDCLHHQSSANMLRRQRMLHLINEMEQSGFSVRVIKGYALAECYFYPESRESSDVDILIDANQEEAICDFLSAKGFTIQQRSLTSHHVVCQHKKYGVLEVHICLYDEIISELWFFYPDFSTPQEEACQIELSDGQFYTLGYTDHLIFITLHMLKHFIFNGLSLGMMLDVALFYAQNANKVDQNRFWTLLEQIRCKTIVSCILKALTVSGEFSTEEFPGMASVSDEQIQTLIEDLLCGGRMGVKEETARREAGYEYSRRIMCRKKSHRQYLKYMLVWRFRSLYRGFVPTLKHLERSYSYLEKRKWLLPVAWLTRLVSNFGTITRIKPHKRIRSEQTELSQISRRRIDMFMRLDML